GGQIRDPQADLVAGRLGLRELLFRALELLFYAAQPLALLRCRLALSPCAAAKLVDARHELPPALVGGEPGVELLGRALAREAAPELVRLVAGCSGVDHGSESREVSRKRATPSSCTEGTPRSAPASTSSCAFATATPKPAQSRSSRSFSPSPQATVCSGPKPSRSATKARPLALLTSGCANSRKYGSDLEM